MQAIYIGIDGATYEAEFSPAANELAGKVSIGVLRVRRNGMLVTEEITTKNKAATFFAEAA